jgi:hypothetical protein
MRTLGFKHSAVIGLIAISMGLVFAASGANHLYADDSLEELLSKAMENHPEVVAAKAKVTLAEAELNTTRLQVARQIIALWGNRDAQVRLVQKNKEVSQKTPGTIPAGDLQDNEAKLHQLETELQYIMGKEKPDEPQSVVSEAPPKPLQIPTGPIVDKLRKEVSAKKIDSEYVETPLEQVIANMADTLAFPFYIDKRALEVSGMGPDMPITMTIKKTPLLATLQAFEDQNPGLEFVIRDYGILLTTANQAKAQGYYPALDLNNLPVKEKSPQTYIPQITPGPETYEPPTNTTDTGSPASSNLTPVPKQKR